MISRRSMVLAAALPAAWMVPARAQPVLSPADHDRFVREVVMKAGNGSREEWLASYDAVLDFVGRVQQEVAQLPDARKQVFARSVHDLGYWKGQELRVADPRNPFLGARLRGTDSELAAVLTPQGAQAWRERYAQGARGYRFNLDIVADREGFFRLQGKALANAAEWAAGTAIVNANAQSWDALVLDAAAYPDPAERLRVLVGNQLGAIASALSLMRGSQPLDDAAMDYATAVIWRYTGHYSGRDGWDKVPLVRVPYAQLPESEKAKDRPIWKAVQQGLRATGLAPG
ncbi:MAG: hypothetical protein FGM55_03485 [Rhodoferax sp.]|nr:hypothetical protein [Rhodoferax sp.]